MDSYDRKFYLTHTDINSRTAGIAFLCNEFALYEVCVMARLPQVGGDEGNWGDVLNDFLGQVHTDDGTLKTASVGAPQLKSNSVTTAALAPNSVTEAQLATAIQASLTKADSALQTADITSKLDTTAAASTYLPVSAKGVASGVASLDTTAKMPDAQLPSRLGATELSATFALPVKSTARPTAILFGTSLEANPYIGSDSLNPADASAVVGGGWLTWFQAYMGHRFRMVKNAGIGGNTYAQMLARIETDVMAYPSEWVIIGAPHNDYGGGTTAAQTIADMTAIHARITGAGRRILQLTCQPHPNVNTTARRLIWDTINAHILSLQGVNGVVVASASTAVAAADGYTPADGTTVDGVHWTQQGAHRIGRQAAGSVSAVLPPMQSGLGWDLDLKNAISNPGFTAGTGWSSTSASNLTVTYPGVGRAALVISGLTARAGHGIDYIESISAGKFAVGDVVRLSVRISWNSLVPLDVAAPCHPFVRVQQRRIDNSFGAQTEAFYAASGDYRIGARYPESGSMTLRTYAVTITENTDRLYIRLGWDACKSVNIEYSELLISRT